MTKMNVNIAGVEFKNPLISASGVVGFGKEYDTFYPISQWGGISCKGTTIAPRAGNAPPRVTETRGGMLNSIGLQNPGIENFLNEDLPWLKQQDVVVIANIAGSTTEEYQQMARCLNDSCVDMVEMNISCPNVKEGGVHFGTSAHGVEAITMAVRKCCKKPLMVKLSPNVSDIGEIALAAESGGADAISMINTLTGMKIDIHTKRPVLANNIGGLSGPAVLPVAVRMVWQAAQRVKIPIIGMGGITSWEDAVEIMLAGASAFQVGTAFFTDPYVHVKILNGIEKYLKENDIDCISQLSGQVNLW